MLIGGCKGRMGNNAQTSTATNTIAPAAGKPAPTPASDEALTDTVELQDNQDRSSAEGGALTEPATARTETSVAAKRKAGAPSRKQSQPRPAGRAH